MKALVIVLALLIPCGFAAKILAFFSVPTKSSHFFFQPILHGLAERGHHIDYYTHFPTRAPHENITEIVFEDYYSRILGTFSFAEQWKYSVLHQMSTMWKMILELERSILQTETVRRLLSSEIKYDLLIHEGVLGFESANAFKHKFNIQSVILLSIGDLFHLNEMSGLVNNPSYMVHAFTEHTERMSFFERLHNTYLLAGTLFTYFSYLRELQNVLDQFLTYPGWESRPSLFSLTSDQALILVNSHHSVGYAYPKPPHVKEIGGAVILPKKPLPQSLMEFIDGAEHGVIYFSMGTRFPLEDSKTNLRGIFSRVFARRKERILWKSKDDMWEGLPPNVKLSNWLPQQDILAHKNVKLFITHAGLQSFIETVNFGVPVIAIPTFADQVRNSLAITYHGYGVRLMMDNITESSLTWALDEVLYQPKYKRSIVKGSAILRNRSVNPVDEGMYWIEYILRHGNVLQPVGLELNFIQLHCLDVYAFILVVFLITLYSLKRILSYVGGLYKTIAITGNNMKKQK